MFSDSREMAFDCCGAGTAQRTKTKRDVPKGTTLKGSPGDGDSPQGRVPLINKSRSEIDTTLLAALRIAVGDHRAEATLIFR
jgi:hypothetical protein